MRRAICRRISPAEGRSIRPTSLLAGWFAAGLFFLATGPADLAFGSERMPRHQSGLRLIPAADWSSDAVLTEIQFNDDDDAATDGDDSEAYGRRPDPTPHRSCDEILGQEGVKAVVEDADAALAKSGLNFHGEEELTWAFQEHVDKALATATTGNWADDIVLRNDLAAEIERLSPEELAACLPNYAKAVAGIKEFRRAEVEQYEQSQEQERQDDEAEQREAMMPENQLRNAYASYIIVQQCHEAREGYALVYVSDEELERARAAVKRIEGKIAGENTDLDTDRLWSEASQPEEDKNLTAEQKAVKRMAALAMLGGQKNACKVAMQNLAGILAQVDPDALIPKKDF